ncbi:MAG: UDP-2,3-diacylglucosamine diphosphatase [Candidatus Cyclobacteriaceae bacterium M3_2C_046]
MNQVNLTDHKKIYFASDFHLGAYPAEQSMVREKLIVSWLDQIKPQAQALFLLGDIFDFWYEYKYVVPKGFVRLLGKLAEFSDRGIKLYFFTGNHDMWIQDYFFSQFNLELFHDPQSFQIRQNSFYIGHGDGLGPGDHTYKLLKKIFRNKLCRKAFSGIHPYIGMGLAQKWSKHSRLKSLKKEEPFLGDDEWIYIYCKEIEQQKHHDYYIFGHRHLPLNLPVLENSRYYNLGEWINHCTYGEYDGHQFLLKEFST